MSGLEVVDALFEEPADPRDHDLVVKDARIAELERALTIAYSYIEMLERVTGVEHGALAEIRAALGEGK